MQGTFGTLKARTLVAVLMELVGLATGAPAATAFAHDARALVHSVELSDLRVRPESSADGYSRDAWKHWSDARENGWRIPAGPPTPAPAALARRHS